MIVFPVTGKFFSLITCYEYQNQAQTLAFFFVLALQITRDEEGKSQGLCLSSSVASSIMYPLSGQSPVAAMGQLAP